MLSRRYPRRRLADADVREAVERWIEDSRLALVERYRPYSGGSGTRFLIRSAENLTDIGESCPRGSVVFVWQLPSAVRGFVDSRFCAAVREELLPTGDFFVGPETRYPAAFEPDYPTTAEELQAALSGLLGREGIAHREPPGLLEYWKDPPIVDSVCARP